MTRQYEERIDWIAANIERYGNCYINEKDPMKICRSLMRRGIYVVYRKTTVCKGYVLERIKNESKNISR